MDPELLNLLQNFKMDDSVIESCINFLFQSSLSEEQYENIIEICNDKLDELKLSKNIDFINKKISEFKKQISNEPELSHLTHFLNNVYKIKAYMNDQNDITEQNPSIEYVIEMNYQKENITLFYTHIYDNIKKTITVSKCITIEPEKEESEESDESDQSDKMSDDEINDDDDSMKELIKFDEQPVDKFIDKMNWDSSIKETLINLLNNIFSIFDDDIVFNW
jgi:hypothetical protein